MNYPQIITEHLSKFEEICRNYNVDKLYVFGSATTEKFNSESDLDFLVEMQKEIEPLTRGENLIALWQDFEALFNRKIDIISKQPIRNPYLRDSINKTKQLIYDRKS